VESHFFPHDQQKVIEKIGKNKLINALRNMLKIRNFELRAEAAYLQGKVGGFLHSYMGQEAIQTSAVHVFGLNNWWATSYRCHALALLLGATTDEMMAELYGRETGNTDRLLGGFGIVGGGIPVATGAAFALKYQDIKDQVAICFFGDGAVAQGAFHESINLASLWDLPGIYVIENNHWGMGTAIEKAICVKRLAADKAPCYNSKGYTLDGMDYFNCYAGFEAIYREVLTTGRPVLVEAVTERFRGHSISDPGLYRSKEKLKETMARDPLILLKEALLEAKIIDEETYKKMDKEMRDLVIASMKYADESPWPDPSTLEEDVFAP
ncbi:MAG: thiamine pyrophosphate-dependent enzyme, partial [Waddliaceae bacterium]